MRKIPSVIWCVLIFGALYLLFRFGIAYVTGAVTGVAAPLPSSLVFLFVGTGAIAILLYVSLTDERWQSFVDPVVEFLGGTKPPAKAKRIGRAVILSVIPMLCGLYAYMEASAEPDPPADPPGIHFNLPGKYLEAHNPLPWNEDNIREGGILYTQNCAVCHGDAQDGNGMAARAWQPKPANFRDPGTIAQLPENYLYWRIKEGGPGVPKGSIEYRSVMPAWETVLSDEQIWKIIMFEYANAGQKPAKR